MLIRFIKNYNTVGEEKFTYSPLVKLKKTQTQLKIKEGNKLKL